MGIFLQIMIGMIPAVLVFVLLSVFRKKGRALSIVMGSVFAAAAVSSLVMHFLYVPEYESVTKEEEDAYLNFAYAIAGNAEGGDIAFDLLAELREDSVDNGKIALCEAYLRALQGDAAGAKVLYQKAEQLIGAEDADFVALCDAVFAEEKIDFAAAGHLGETVDGTAGKALAALRKHAEEKLADGVTSVDYEKAADTLILAEQLFRDYVSNGTLDRETVKAYAARLGRAAEKTPGLLTIPMFRESRLKLQVLGGSYKESAKSIDQNSTYNELAVVSELYLGGFIKENSFSEEYGKAFREQAGPVAEQLRKLLEKTEDKEGALGTKIKDMVELLEGVDKKPALYRLKNAISEVASNADDPDRAKAYIQLAKHEYDEGHAEKAQQHIAASLSTVGLCEDDSFFVPMAQIMDTISDKDDPEKLKDLASYVDDVTNHSSDEVVIKALEEAAPMTEETVDPETGEVQTEQTFEDYMTDEINKTRISLDITGVDASDFETVKVMINVGDGFAGSAEELKETLKVLDCGLEITDFTVEKVEFSASNILLCCDVSGSMSGQPIADLKNAVVKFIETSPDMENIALVAFSDGIEAQYPFGTAKDALISSAQSLYSTGGTNMFDAIVSSIDEFSLEADEVNYILLLSDGQDGYRRDEATIAEAIGDAARERGVILYSLGLGYGVDAAYMSSLANATGGTYVYVPDSTTLDGFYESLRNQVLNRYVITFTAKDTLRVDREVKVYHEEYPSVVFDTQRYSLNDSAEIPDPDETTGSSVALQNKAVYGISPGSIEKSAQPTTVYLSGEGFAEGDEFSIELHGKLTYTSESIACEYVNGSTVKLTLPAGLACGSYDLYVHINDQTGIVTKALSVIDHSKLKTTKFGPYVFTSFSKAESGNTITLSDHVTLNGWLSFDGDVTLTGSLSAYEISMTDLNGCHVSYNVATAKGFAETLAKRCQSLSLGALGYVTLYNNIDTDPDSDDYPVQTIISPLLLLPSFAELDSPGLKLYPYKLIVDADAFTTDLPLQDVLMKSPTKDLFSFENEINGIVTGKTVGFEDTIKLGIDTDDGKKSAVNFGNFKINLFDAGGEFRFNTADNTFGFSLESELPFLFKDTKLSLEMDWAEQTDADGNEKIWLSSAGFGVDKPVKGHIGPVPITVDDFKLKVSDVTPDKNFFLSVFAGSADLGVSKVSDYIPGLEGNVGDVSLLKLDDITLEFSFGQKYIAVETSVKFIDVIDLGGAEIKAGYLPFEVMLLGLEEEAFGLQASITQQIKWDTDNVDVAIGGKGNLNIHATLFALERIGYADIDIGWWIFHENFHAEGRVLLGVYRDDEDLLNFAVIARETDNKKGSEYYLTWNEKTSLDYGKRKV